MKFFYPILLICFVALQACSQRTSNIVYKNKDGQLEYLSDENNNRIVNFSFAGFQYGDALLPQMPVVKTISPIKGDNTQHIQKAINEVAEKSADSEEIRGAILLNPGVYPVKGQLFLNIGGIVLRGSGNQADPAKNTIIKGVGNQPKQRDLIIIGNPENEGWDKVVKNTKTEITNDFLPVGAHSIQVASVDAFEVGDHIMIVHPSTEKWLASVDYGSTDTDDPWRVGRIDIYYNRYIRAINKDQNKLILDVPVYDHFDRSLAQAHVYKFDDRTVVRNAGIENLRIEIETKGSESIDHIESAVKFHGVEDCWAKEVVALHFSYAAIYTYEANRVTIQNCGGLEPHSPNKGGWRYNFCAHKFSNNILFENCEATHGRHSFMSNGRSMASGIVWTNCTTSHDYKASEGHRVWSQALLFDNIMFLKPDGDPLLSLYNRGNRGTSHGWSAVHSVAWNTVMPSGKRLILQQPPGRQNYAIGSRAKVTTKYNFKHPLGFEEATGQEVSPKSLYKAQLEERHKMGIPPMLLQN